MKMNVGLWRILIACGGLALVAPFGAQAQFGQFYVKADLGGEWTHDTGLKEFFGLPALLLLTCGFESEISASASAFQLVPQSVLFRRPLLRCFGL